MKIVYDYQIFTRQKYGGISRYFYEIASRIGGMGKDEVKIIAGLHINNYLKTCSKERVIGWHRPWIPKTTKINNLINTNISKAWVALGNLPDIVHETYYASRAVGLRPRRSVVTVHDMIHEKFTDLFAPKDRQLSLLKALAVRRADWIVCVSHQTKKDLIEILDVNPEKISVIYHGYNLQAITESSANAIHPKYPYILYVGSRNVYKNFDRLLQAYAKHPNLKKNFKLVTIGDKDFSSSELQRMKDLKLTKEDVKLFSGDDRTLATLYKHASVFVYPSLYEGFGMPPLEAMSFDCPVTCSNTSSIPEIVGSAAELFDPYEIDSIADALEKVLFDPEKTKNLVRLGQERIKHFSWDNCAKETRNLYSSLI